MDPAKSCLSAIRISSLSEQSPKLFYPRPVRVGARTEGTIEILAGVLPGEVIVTKGSGVLRGELLKNNLGAG